MVNQLVRICCLDKFYRRYKAVVLKHVHLNGGIRSGAVIAICCASIAIRRTLYSFQFRFANPPFGDRLVIKGITCSYFYRTLLGQIRSRNYSCTSPFCRDNTSTVNCCHKSF